MLENIVDGLETEDEESMMSEEELDTEFIIESIQDQCNNLMNNTSKNNYLKDFENDIKRVDVMNTDRESIKQDLYLRIINIIEDKFGIEIETEEMNLKEMTKNMYKFFILHYTDNIVNFLEMYILENRKTITSELERRNINPRRIEGIPSKKIAIILNNISFTIEIIKSTEVSFREFLKYLNSHPDNAPYVEEIIEYEDRGIISNADNIINDIMEQLVNEEEGFGNIYIELQRKLFERFNNL